MKQLAVFVISFAAIFGGLWLFNKSVQPPSPVPVGPPVQEASELPPVEIAPAPVMPEAHISVPNPSYLPYPQLVEQLKAWNKEAPGLTEVGVVGKTRAGKDIYYIRLSNHAKSDKPEVLITGCIHGNEPWATGIVMTYIGRLLDSYGKDEKITKLLDERDIYFIPVVSPDSYPRSREVDGVDPNRDFESPHSPTIAAIEKFFAAHHFRAAISGHTWGRVYLIPWGDKVANCPHDADYRRIVGQMAKMSNYHMMRACDLYKRGGGLNIAGPVRWGTKGWSAIMPAVAIQGAELDWYYTHGSMDQSKHRGCFTIVCEFGTHQNIPSKQDITSETDRTYAGFLYFLQEAPVTEIYWPN